MANIINYKMFQQNIFKKRNSMLYLLQLISWFQNCQPTWYRVFFKKLTLSQLVKKLPTLI